MKLWKDRGLFVPGMELPGPAQRRIKFAVRGEERPAEYAAQEFERVAGVRYLTELAFADETTYQRIRKQCDSVLQRGAVPGEMKWLGAFYAAQIRNHTVADVSIRWIDETIGYGLFAEQNLDAGAYVGEYTGVVRRRSLLFRNYNEYCFSYPTSDVSFRKYMIDAGAWGNEMRFANHGEDPNCEARCALVDGLLHIIVRATQDISRDAQITYDYSKDYWQHRTPVPNR